VEVSGSCYGEVLGSIKLVGPHQHLVNFPDGGNIKMLDTSQYYPILPNTTNAFSQKILQMHRKKSQKTYI
jgi:hypothetical protein